MEYERYFNTKASLSKNCGIAWRIAQYAIGVFAYPVFALLGVLETGVRLYHLPGLIKHNSETKLNFASQCLLPTDPSEGCGGCGYGGKEGPQLSVIEYIVILNRTHNLEQQKKFGEDARLIIDKYTWCFKKVYVYSEGQINDDGTGFLKICLETAGPAGK